MKKMRKMIIKDDFSENGKPSGKVRKPRPQPSSKMVIRRGLFGEDLNRARP